uniref:Uncharacterized protein n=1 Tax=Euplotes harpa TaxID=151035 RepID=A0A7S3NH47_9SPIT
MVVMRRVENNERPELNLEQLFSMLFSYAIVNDMIDDQYNLTINCKQNPNEGPSKMLMKCFLPKIKSVIIQNTFQNDEQLRVFLNEAFTKAAFENLEVNIGDEAQFGIEQYRPNIELAMPFIKNSLTLSGYSIALSDFQELVNKFNHGNELIFRNCNFTQVGTAPAFQNIDNPTLKTLTFIGCNITEQAHKDQITAAIAACNLNNIPTNVVYQ